MDPLADKTDFPFFTHNPERTYLDSAATSLVPERVLKEVVRYYREVGGAAGRSAHLPALRATALMEDARYAAAAFFKCRPQEVIFVANATDAINGVAAALPWSPGDRILVTLWEHHANLLPWLGLRERRGVEVEVLSPDPDGHYTPALFRDALKRQPARLVAFTHRSNVTGTPTDAAAICRVAREAGAWTLVDGAQSAPHDAVDFPRLGADFFAFSAHKALGPKGAGVLLARAELQGEMRPWRLGGGIVADVDTAGYALAEGPGRFEAGTPDIAAIAGMAEALSLLNEIGMTRVAEHDRALGAYLRAGLQAIPNITVFGSNDPQLITGTCAFAIAGIPPHRAASLYDKIGAVAVRAGHHCALPFTKKVIGRREGTIRASAYVYNDRRDVDRFLEVTETLTHMANRAAKPN